jgi:uncharacterized ion transporter superfamily protein YfcC
MLERLAALELCRSGPTGIDESLSRRVRNQMQMKEIYFVLHVVFHHLLISGDYEIVFRRGAIAAGISAKLSTIANLRARENADCGDWG